MGIPSVEKGADSAPTRSLPLLLPLPARNLAHPVQFVVPLNLVLSRVQISHPLMLNWQICFSGGPVRKEAGLPLVVAVGRGRRLPLSDVI